MLLLILNVKGDLVINGFSFITIVAAIGIH